MPHYQFGAVLARVRREAGHQNAHSFYKGRGGAAVLRLSYANYLALERGRSLPKPQRLHSILQALELPMGSQSRVELVRAYLAAMLGSDELLKELDEAHAGVGPAPMRLGEEAARQSVRQRAFHLSVDQWKARAQDFITHDCDVYLLNTPGFVTLREVAEATKHPVDKVKKAVQALAACKLVELSGDRARSRLSYKVTSRLPVTAATSGLAARILDYRRKILDRSKIRQDWWLNTRMTERNFERFLQYANEALHVGAIFGDADKAPDTRVYGFQLRVFEMFP